MKQIIFDFGTLPFLDIPLRVFGYGLMLVCGFLTAILFARWRAKRAGEYPDSITYIGMLALLGGVVGARLAYVFKHWDTYSAPGASFSEIFNVTSGGLIYFGGLAGGAVLVLLALWISKLPMRRFLDIVAPSLMIGLAFGRMGCTLNGCCWGGPCSENWALGMKFPMISKPLLKFDGNPDSPYSSGQTMSPTYSHQYQQNEVHPDKRLLSRYVNPNYDLENGHGSQRLGILPVTQLHGKLTNDQLTITQMPTAEAKKLFDHISDYDGKISKQQWETARRDGTGFLRGSEVWNEAIQFAIATDPRIETRLSFEEAMAYLTAREKALSRQASLQTPDKQLDYDKASAYLQADLYEVLGNQWSNPRKPAQVLGIANALILAGLLGLFYRHRWREGQVFALMLMLYPPTRFMLESIRDDDPLNVIHGNWTHNQISAIFMVAAGILMWLWFDRRPASAGPAAAERRLQKTNR
ncbi:MAG: prolipoprotein diacylglyceryl transferase [Phycisphaerae bacterium]|nr:prolipoprotein diacylglyceryl transferase [Phycisphaerae bacterium]